MWVWYSLVSAQADRKSIDDYMFLRKPVDFAKAPPWKDGAEKFQSWIDKGYVGTQLGGLNFEQATVNFLSGEKAMLIWNQGTFERIRKDATFDWGYFTLPGAHMQMGSSGHLWGVPANAKNKELAYDWIDTTLSPEVQNKIGELGGLPPSPVMHRPSRIRSRRPTPRGSTSSSRTTRCPTTRTTPVPGFLDFIQSNMQAMSNGNLTADEFTAKLQKFYDDGRKAALAG